jgi:hypothetical protein
VALPVFLWLAYRAIHGPERDITLQVAQVSVPSMSTGVRFPQWGQQK